MQYLNTIRTDVFFCENNRADQTTSVIKYLKGDMTTDHGQVPVIDFCTKAFLQQQPLGGVH